MAIIDVQSLCYHDELEILYIYISMYGNVWFMLAKVAVQLWPELPVIYIYTYKYWTNPIYGM